MKPQGFLFPLFFPSFVLLAAVGTPGLEEWAQHREVFGSANYYLTLEYAQPPDGPLSPEGPTHFSGSLVTPQGESRISGVRQPQGREWVYEVASSQGAFEGRLSRDPNHCPRFFSLEPVLAENGLPKELLRSGECP